MDHVFHLFLTIWLFNMFMLVFMWYLYIYTNLSKQDLCILELYYAKYYQTCKRHGVRNLWEYRISGPVLDFQSQSLHFYKLPIFCLLKIETTHSRKHYWVEYQYSISSACACMYVSVYIECMCVNIYDYFSKIGLKSSMKLVLFQPNAPSFPHHLKLHVLLLRICSELWDVFLRF